MATVHIFLFLTLDPLPVEITIQISTNLTICFSQWFMSQVAAAFYTRCSLTQQTLHQTRIQIFLNLRGLNLLTYNEHCPGPFQIPGIKHVIIPSLFYIKRPVTFEIY